MTTLSSRTSFSPSLSRTRTFLCVALLASTSACLPCCGNTQAGDATAEVSLEPLAFQGDGDWHPIPQDAPLPTVIGGQGFTMIVLGVRATNVDTCGVKIHATLTDLQTMELVADAEDDRNLSMIDETTAESAKDPNGNEGLQVVPSFPYDPNRCGPAQVRLDVTITDRNGKTASASRVGSIEDFRAFPPCQDGGM